MIRFGLRLSLRTGREALLRLVITAAAVSIGVAVLLTTLAAIHAVYAQNDRYGWLETSSAPSTTKVADGDPLWWLLRDDHVDGQLIGRIDVAATGPHSPVPPGIDRLPRPGEFFASPAMIALLQSHPELRARFPGEQAGVIGHSALPAPDSLLIINGQSPAVLAQWPDAEKVTTISTAESPGDCSGGCASFGFDASALILILAVVAGAILFPVLVFIGTATRLSAARREQRFAAMRLVGATPRQVSTVAAVDATLAAVVGTATGFALFLLLRPVIASIPFTGARFFSSDLSLSPLDVLLVGVGVPVAAAAIARLTLRRVNISPLGVSRRTTPRPPRAYRFVVLLAGTAVLMYFVIFGAPDSGQAQAEAYLSGMLLVMAGLVVAGPWLTMAGARVLARRANGPAGLIAARRLADNPQAGFRAISGLVLALFVTTAAIGTISTWVAYRGAPNHGGTATGTLVEDFRTFTRDGPDGIPSLDGSTVAGVRSIPGVRGVTVVHIQPSAVRNQPDQGLVLCSELAKTPALGRCRSGAETASIGNAYGSGDAGRQQGWVWPEADVSAAQLRALPVASLFVWAPGDPRAIEAARTALELARPGWNTPKTLADIGAYELQLTTQYRQLSDVVIIVSLFLAGCSLAVSVAAGLADRKRPFSLLRLSGTPLQLLRRVITLESAVPLLIASAVAIAAGFVVAGLFVEAQLGYTLQAPGPSYYVIVGLGILASLAVIASTLPIIDRITGPETARNE